MNGLETPRATRAGIAPASLEEATAVLAEAAARKETVSFRGGGTELGFGYALPSVDLLVRTERLARIVDYSPADQVVEVEAGLTLGALQTALGAQGQRLAIDPPQPELATLGGLVATNAFGPLRTRFGTFRDLIVGVSLLRADGTRVRGGGKVVKNVAGFDLPKLAVGSLGTLGMLATLTFRLHPLPESSRAVCVRTADPADLRRLAARVTARQLEPSAFVSERLPAGYDTYAIFEGFPAGVDEQVERFAAAVAELGLEADTQPAGGVQRLRAREEAVRTHGDVRVRFSVPAAALDVLERDALAPVTQALDGARLVVYPLLGVAFLGADAPDVPAAASALLAARRSAEAVGGNAVLLEAREPALRERVDVYGTLPAAFPLMRGLKERFDPERRLNPGRFLGGL